ncbi:hypothetical protein [Melissococcus plutonius]|uniref:hypothetical protein n=1 Tax=Melissococcus plutonius TaxID=33970 RepID=UPI003C2CCDE2
MEKVNQEICCFVSDFLENIEDHSKTFSLNEIERNYNKKKGNTLAEWVHFTNTQRSIITSKILKDKRMKRMYKPRANGGCWLLFYTN